MDKQFQILYTIGFILELTGIVLTFLFSPKLLYGMYMRDNNQPTKKEKRNERIIKFSFWLIVIGGFAQLTESVISCLK